TAATTDDGAAAPADPAPQALGAVRTAGIGVNTLAENLAIAAGLALVGGIVVAAGLLRRRRSIPA
ncbi:amidase, partial [Clavibacter phaseoli]